MANDICNNNFRMGHVILDFSTSSGNFFPAALNCIMLLHFEMVYLVNIQFSHASNQSTENPNSKWTLSFLSDFSKNEKEQYGKHTA